jgi:amino acid transporter
MALVGGFSWGIFYSIRKIGMNVYRHLKFEYDLPDKHFKLKVPNPKIKYILITLLTFLLVLFIVFSNRAKSSMDIFKKFDGKEIPVIIYFILLGYLVYDSNDTFIYQGNPTQIK